MSVRKRSWTRNGVVREAWVVDYVDQDGDRHIKTFTRKKEADAYHASVNVDVARGIHTADSKSITVAEAGQRWIEDRKAAGLERSTLDQYRQHLEHHIAPYLGEKRLSQLTAPIVYDFEDRLRIERSPALVRKVMGSLGSIITAAQERGLVAQNVVKGMSRRKRGHKAEKRHKGKLKIGVDIPAPAEIKAIVGALHGRWRPLLLIAIFTGLRASELRGLRWEDTDLKRAELHVRQRADRRQTIGKPKTVAGQRTVPLPPIVVSTLREWKLACPKGPLDLVFPNRHGTVEWHNNIINRGLIPIQIAAGVVDACGRAKYSGLHAFRHFYASWCINRKADGGLELPAKIVQTRLGHASITVTYNTYSHLFPHGDGGAELAAAERALLG